MKICFLSDARAEHTRRWTRYYALKGHDVDVITLNPDMLDGYDPVRVHLLKKDIKSQTIFGRIAAAPTVIMRLKKLLSELKPDVLHAHSAGGYSWLAYLSGFRPYIVTPWGTDLYGDIRTSWITRFMTVRALTNAALVTTDGVHMKNTLMKLGVKEKNIAIIFFGTDVDRFSPRTSNETLLKEKYRIKDKLVVVSTRTLEPVHDVESFVRSIPFIKKDVPNTAFIMVGGGSLQTKLGKLAEDLGVSEATRFVGRVDEDTMAAWLQNSDVYVSTSLMDGGLAGSTAEAMACELPVVITDNADNRNWVGEGHGGYFMPEKSPEVIAKYVIRLLNDSSMRKQFGIENRRIIVEKNNYSTEMNRMEALYKSVAKREM